MDREIDRSVLVTGGTGEIGLAIARAFLDTGAVVAIAGSTAERLEAAEAGLATYGARIHGFVADVRTAEATAKLIEAVERRCGPIGVLVNGAGISFSRPILEIDEDDYDRVMATNTKSAFFTSQIVARKMIAAGRGGRIVNITSGNYRYTRPAGSIYSASKAAMEMLARSFAVELGSYGITVNCVAPGLVRRASLEGTPGFERFSSYYVANSALGRLTEPEEVAAAVLFLASEQAANITGETIVVDGGFSAGRFDFPTP